MTRLTRLIDSTQTIRIAAAAGAVALVATAAGVGWTLAGADRNQSVDSRVSSSQIVDDPPAGSAAGSGGPSPAGIRSSGQSGQPAGDQSGTRGGEQAGGGEKPGRDDSGGGSESTAPPQQGGGEQAEPTDGPMVEFFRISGQPSCPAGTNLNPIEGTPVMLEWRVTGAEQVTLSIDGTGAFDTYPAEGSASLPFPCDGTAGQTQQHTYLLATVTDQPVTATLVASATINEITQV